MPVLSDPREHPLFLDRMGPNDLGAVRRRLRMKAVALLVDLLQLVADHESQWSGSALAHTHQGSALPPCPPGSLQQGRVGGTHEKKSDRVCAATWLAQAEPSMAGAPARLGSTDAFLSSLLVGKDGLGALGACVRPTAILRISSLPLIPVIEPVLANPRD